MGLFDGIFGGKKKDALGDALIRAVKSGRAEEVRAVLSRGANIDAGDAEGYTSLHYAVMDRSEKLVELLLEGGANVNAREQDGWTPLHWAAHEGFRQICELLLRRGADRDLRDGKNLRPVDRALAGGHAGIVALLEVTPRAKSDGRCADCGKSIGVWDPSAAPKGGDLQAMLRSMDGAGQRCLGMGCGRELCHECAMAAGRKLGWAAPRCSACGGETNTMST